MLQFFLIPEKYNELNILHDLGTALYILQSALGRNCLENTNITDRTIQ